MSLFCRTHTHIRKAARNSNAASSLRTNKNLKKNKKNPNCWPLDKGDLSDSKERERKEKRTQTFGPNSQKIIKNKTGCPARNQTARSAVRAFHLLAYYQPSTLHASVRTCLIGHFFLCALFVVLSLSLELLLCTQHFGLVHTKMSIYYACNNIQEWSKSTAPFFSLVVVV